MPDYLDTSAFIKLVRSEPDSPALRARLVTADALVSSALLLVEGQRAAARYGSLALDRARNALRTITLLPLDDLTLQSAATLGPATLRSLDALHLATAMSLGDDLGRFYCYDGRLISAARAVGVRVLSPS